MVKEILISASLLPLSSKKSLSEVLKERAIGKNREGFSFYRVDTDDFGGEQVGNLAACFLGAENYGVRAVVSAFATDFGMIFLGAGLREAEGQPIHTTVNQCNNRGEIVEKENGALVIHDGVAYRNLDSNTAFRVKCEHRAYDYKRNYFENGQKVLWEADLFMLDIPTDQSYGKYAYMITPEEYSDKTVKILENSEAIQAIILPDGVIMAVFHTDATLKTPNGEEISGKKCEAKIISAK